MAALPIHKPLFPYGGTFPPVLGNRLATLMRAFAVTVGTDDVALGNLAQQVLLGYPSLMNLLGEIAKFLLPFALEASIKRVRRIELPCPAWKAGALPLSYTRVSKEKVKRQKEKAPMYSTFAFFLVTFSLYQVGREGFEPP